jgi:hypothetical protein
MYADDVTLILRNARDLSIAEGILQLYEQGSGARLNSGKCELMRIAMKDQALPEGCRFTLRPVDHRSKLLGAPIA